MQGETKAASVGSQPGHEQYNTSQLQPSLHAELLCYADDAEADPAIPAHAQQRLARAGVLTCAGVLSLRCVIVVSVWGARAWLPGGCSTMPSDGLHGDDIVRHTIKTQGAVSMV